MKKSKLPLSLVATFVAAMGMSSCSSVKSSKTDILSFKGYDGVTYSIVTDDMYAEYQTTENITKFYNPILEVMVRNEFKKDNSPIAEKTKSYAQIEQLAKESVKDKKKEAEDSSESYSKAWESILDSYGVENEKELLQHFIYEEEKKCAEDWYYDVYKEYLTKEFIGVTATGEAYKVDQTSPYPYEGGKINSRMPYHIRHILVNNSSGSGTEYGVDKISEDTAKKLANVVEELLDGEKSFGQIANTRSEDSGSAAKYGDVGIMTNEASTDGSLKMVSEFQLGIYAYDVILGTQKAKATETVKNGLGISADVEAQIVNDLALKDNSGDDGIAGLTRVPASVFEDLKTYADKVEAEDGYDLAKGKEEIYPRNILWNKYLNHHNPFIITNNERVATGAAPATWATEEYNQNIATGAVAGTYVEGRCGYRSAKALGLIADTANDFGVLCDEQGNVIIGVRSNYGIHFMIVQKSILDYNDGTGEAASLEQYYTTSIPSDVDYPAGKSTYVSYIQSENESDYKTRADEIKSAIKGYDSTYEYRLFEKLYDMNKSNFNLDESGQKLINNILNYIKVQRESKVYDQQLGMGLAWDKYFEMIELQNETRENNKRVIPEGCIVGFNKELKNLTEAEKAQYEEGGACYYGK